MFLCKCGDKKKNKSAWSTDKRDEFYLVPSGLSLEDFDGVVIFHLQLLS